MAAAGAAVVWKDKEEERCSSADVYVYNDQNWTIHQTPSPTPGNISTLIPPLLPHPPHSDGQDDGEERGKRCEEIVDSTAS